MLSIDFWEKVSRALIAKLLSNLGGYGKVMRCVHKTSGEVRAVKIMEKEKISA